MNLYYCSKCHGLAKRESDKRKIKSFCDTIGKDTFLVKVKNANELAIKLRKKFLKNQFELDSFKPKERKFLESAFEQGVIVTFNSIR